MKLYTKTGDGGETGLLGGQRVSKAHPRVVSYGDVDELNAVIGWTVSACDDENWRDHLLHICDRLFVLGAELADPKGAAKTPNVAVGDITRLEGWIDAATMETPPLRHFILPGGCEFAARLHLARTVCRRAERSVIALSTESDIRGLTVVYLNRLADLLFAWSRLANHRAGATEYKWEAPPPQPGGSDAASSSAAASDDPDRDSA